MVTLAFNSGVQPQRMWARLSMVLALFPAMAQADERSTALTSDFQFFCTQAVPDFERLDSTAKTMNLAVQREIQPSASQGDSIHSKAWAVSDQTGPYELAAAEGFNAGRRVEGCGVGADDVKGEDIRRDIAQAMKLGDPIREIVASDGKSKAVFWLTRMGANEVTVLLTYAYPNGQGMSLNLLEEWTSSE